MRSLGSSGFIGAVLQEVVNCSFGFLVLLVSVLFCIILCFIFCVIFLFHFYFMFFLFYFLIFFESCISLFVLYYSVV